MSAKAIAATIVLWMIRVVGTVTVLSGIFWLFAKDPATTSYQSYWWITFFLFFVFYGLIAMFNETKEWVKRHVNL